MRNQPNPNIQSLLKIEFVKRFEAMMRQELALHSKALFSYQEEMQSLKDSVKQAKGAIESLFRHTEVEMKDTNLAIQNQISTFEIKTKSLEINALDQRNTILSLYQSFNDFMEISSKKNDFENYKAEINSKVTELNNTQTRSFEDYQQHMKSLFNQVIEEQKNLRVDVESKINNLKQVINEKYDHFRMDKDGIQKEIKVYEKTIFIIEKKIENIYTLIERINKRGEVCHKQD